MKDRVKGWFRRLGGGKREDREEVLVPTCPGQYAKQSYINEVQCISKAR